MIGAGERGIKGMDRYHSGQLVRNRSYFIYSCFDSRLLHSRSSDAGTTLLYSTASPAQLSSAKTCLSPLISVLTYYVFDVNFPSVCRVVLTRYIDPDQYATDNTHSNASTANTGWLNERLLRFCARTFAVCLHTLYTMLDLTV